MSAVRALLAASLTLAALLAGPALAGTPLPSLALRVIRESERVRLFPLGAPRWADPLAARTATDPLLGREIGDAVPLAPDEADALRALLGTASFYGDTTKAETLIPASGTFVGLSFEAPGAFVRAVVLPDRNAIHLEFHNGVRWTVVFSEQGRARWPAWQARFLKRRGQTPVDFVRAFAAGGAPPGMVRPGAQPAAR